jgi:hypothetical protein
MFGVFPLTPAYGRDYKSKAAVLADWIGGKEFLTSNGKYCSIRDFADHTDGIEVRYKRKTELCFLRRRADGSWKV